MSNSDSDESLQHGEAMQAGVAGAAPPVAACAVRRLVVKDIVMHNFKSYAGTHVVGPFHKTFTAVIGPNGSGKSNVIDAMLFVFGKQAKKIRLEKLSELIHSSAAHPNLTSASVTVNFVEVDDDPTEQTKWTEIGRTAFSVTREVQRNNTSQYYIDGTKQTQKQVVAELIQRGIDLEHNRFLILQGEVEQIALMKPKAEKEGEEGLLEYFDDLIGTNRYIDAIKEATLAAEKCQEERLSSLDQVEKVRKERETLDSAKQQTIKYAKKDNLVQKLLSILCQGRVREHEKQLEEPRQVVAAFDKDLARLSAELREVEAERQRAQARTKEAQKAAIVHQKDREVAQKALQQVEEEVAAAKAAVDDAEKTRKKESDKIKKLQDEMARLALDTTDNARDVDIASRNLTDAASELEARLPELERKRDEIQQDVLPKRKQLELLRREAAPYDKKVAEGEIALDTARQRLEDCGAALSKAEEEHARANTDLDRTQQRITEVRRILDEAKVAKSAFVGDLERIEAEIERAERRTREVDQQITQVKNQVRENESDDKITSFLRDQRGLRYRGPLRSLGNLNDKYDVAAGVAGGAHWGFHIVDDQAAATEALDLLRQHNLGRATFLPLDKITRDMEPQMRDQVLPPKGCERLFDLISCEKEYAPLFYFAVRNTLVTNDDALARHIGLGKNGGPRARVVTLNGMLVEPGVVTGGGSALPQGARLRATQAGMDRAKVHEVLLGLQKQLQDAFNEANQLKQQRDAIGAAARSKLINRDEEARLAAELRSLEVSLKTFQHRALVASQTVEEARRLSSSAAMKDAVRSVEESERALEEAQRIHDQYHQRIKELQEAIDRIGGPEFIALRERVAQLQTTVKEQEAKHHAALNAMQRARVSAERKAKELEALRLKMDETAETATKAAKAELEALNEKAVELGQTLKKHMALQREAEAALAEQQRHLEACDERMKHIQEQQSEVEANKAQQLESMRVMLEKIEKLTAKIASCDEKIVNNVKDFGVETWSSDDRRSETPTADEEERLLEPFNNGTFTTRIEDASELLGYETEQTHYMVRELSEELSRIRDTIDFNAVSRWREKDTAYKTLRAQYDALLEQLEAAELHLATLKIERKSKFMATFTEIQKKLKQMYQLLANGGDAEIELLDSSDPFEGINFVVRPPKKAWKNVGNLSGGEKTLSSLALVFALHHVKPTPVYVMDEIDAALDFRNVSIVARYVLERAVGAQFIIISLRNNMFELAHQLVGICKINDCTRSVVVNPGTIADMIRTRSIEQHAGRRSAAVAEVEQENRGGKRPPRPEVPRALQSQSSSSFIDA